MPSIARQTCPEGDQSHEHLAPVFAVEAKCVDGVGRISRWESERRSGDYCTGANGSWECL